MSDLLDLVVDTFPAEGDVGVPLRTEITLTLSGLDYDTTSIEEGFFVEGPDTDQFVGPGLIELQNNVSQGDLDDFLESPGMQGIVQGEVTVSGIDGNTVITFTSTNPLAPQITYIANLSDVLTAGLVAIDGFVSFSFETGTGSIEVIPSTVSSSVLSSSFVESTIADALTIVSISPADRSVQNPLTLNEIVITFNKAIDPASIDETTIIIETIPVTDHPNAVTNSLGELAKVVEIVGEKLKLKI